jgi:hypothetical protein
MYWSGVITAYDLPCLVCYCEADEIDQIDSVRPVYRYIENHPVPQVLH